MADTSMPSGATRRYQDKREALVAAASALFDMRGVIGTTLAEVGSSVGLVKNSVTYYFKRKEILAQACFIRGIDIHEGLIEQAARSAAPAERIAELFRLQFGLHADIAAGRRTPVVAFHEIRALPEPQLSHVFTAYNGLFRRLRDFLAASVAANWQREHLNARTHLLLSLLYAIKPLVGRYEPEDHSRVCERLTDIALHGMGAAASTWTSEGAEMRWLAQVPERDLRAQFLRVATELINEQGYAGASVNRIAERLNFTKGGFYYYNQNKEELIAQCFEHSVATIRKVVSLTEGDGGSGWEHLGSIARGLVRLQFSDDGPLLRSTANAALPDASHRARVSEETRRVTERIAGVVVGGLMDASIRPLDPTLAAHVLLAGVMAAAELERWVPNVSADGAVGLYARPLMMGLLSPIADA